MTRRQFGTGLALTPGRRSQAALNLTAVPNFCSHEHWGSIDSIGVIPGGYRCDYEQGAQPQRATSVFDLLLEPYLRGLLLSAGVSREALTSGTDWNWYTKLQQTLQPYTSTGIFQCTRRGILMLYGFDLLRLTPDQLTRLNESVERRYRQPSTWYADAMKAANFVGLIRPVHPEFYRQTASAESASAEARLMRTVMRIDPFLEFSTGPSERRNRMVALSGIQPADAKSWRAFLDYWFQQAAQNGAAGIKQLQAYRRDLDFAARSDAEISWSENDDREVRKRQDWIVHECCRRAHEAGWAHQIHVGTHNLPNSSPLPLARLAKQYPKMKVVMIHCWPFLDEAGTLARQISNMYIDTCWQPVLNPAFFRTAISKWWNYVPGHKITCGHDATTVEMAAGSSLYTREILAEVIPEQTRYSGLTEKALENAARNLLCENARKLYSR